MFKIMTTNPVGNCCAYRCKAKKAAADRFCHKHRKRYGRETDPERYTYNALKCNARRRQKQITLTLQEFRNFCAETNYMALKGRKASSASIDCINPALGYCKDNIQILSLSDNSKKMHQDKNNPYDDVPF